MYGAAVVGDGVLVHVLPISGDRTSLVGGLLLAGVLNLVAVALLMNFSTPEKKLSRKIEHKYAIADPQFQREMSVLLGPAMLSGNRVTDLQNGDEIFPAMLEAVAAAQRYIRLATYITGRGEAGRV